jgi:hypothetical protein
MALLSRKSADGREGRAQHPTLDKPDRKGFAVLGRALGSLFLALLLIFSSFTSEVSAETHRSREYLVKAAFLYNFAKFVEWPEGTFSDETSPMVLCILGDDPFGDSIDSIRGKTIMGRELLIKRISDEEEIGSCHIVFVSESERGRISYIIRKARRLNILTVGDMGGFARRGGIIGFIMRKNKVRFEINVDAAEGSKLKISSKLLKLATIVNNGD